MRNQQKFWWSSQGTRFWVHLPQLAETFACKDTVCANVLRHRCTMCIPRTAPKVSACHVTNANQRDSPATLISRPPLPPLSRLAPLPSLLSPSSSSSTITITITIIIITTTNIFIYLSPNPQRSVQSCPHIFLWDERAARCTSTALLLWSAGSPAASGYSRPRPSLPTSTHRVRSLESRGLGEGTCTFVQVA